VNLNKNNNKNIDDSRRIRRTSTRFYMSTKTDIDFYVLLGISRNADADDIKHAYWEMAKKLHPDASANKNKKDATEKFQEVNRAYEVLKDRDLKRKYDMRGKKAKATPSYRRSPYDSPYGGSSVYGSSPFGNGGSTYGSNPTSRSSSSSSSSSSSKGSYSRSPFSNSASSPFTKKAAYGPTGFSHSNPGEIFENEAYPSSSTAKTTADDTGEVASRGPVTVGDDLRADLEINNHTATVGGEEKVTIQQLEQCNVCTNGVKPGSKVSICNDCEGTGVTTTTAKNRYPYQSPPKCSSCNGSGKRFQECCESCRGKGLISKSKDITIVVPPAVKQTHTVFVSGAGNAGPNGGPHGDLYIFLRMNPNLKDPVPEEEKKEDEKVLEKVEVEIDAQKVELDALNVTIDSSAQNITNDIPKIKTEAKKVKTDGTKKVKNKKSYKSKSKKYKYTKDKYHKTMKP